MTPHKHTIHCRHHHFGWDNTNTPVCTAASGDTITFETVDSSGGQLNGSSTLPDLVKLDFGKVNPVTGPVVVDGAKPGDAVKLTLLDFAPTPGPKGGGWGWTGLIPGFGLLADQFKEPDLYIWKYDAAGSGPLLFGPSLTGKCARIPLRPFAGTIGLALAENGPHSVVPPRRVGGNMDFRDLTKGAEILLPVEVAGALLSLGDTHAAQGDGEVCGTAIESPMTVTAKIELVKGAGLKFPRAFIPGGSSRPVDAAGYDVTTGIGPDLMTGAKDAVAGMIDLLCARHKITVNEAYMLCSVAGDLAIAEIVDMPNWIVTFRMPRSIFD
ncbi:MAG: acetamidase/formamidase family protein [Rhodospirillaceae bacterium]|nr:acetamidase/formamidase family protein [Rhodospirillaceae bacterium]